nr:hypothetical protein Iba_chr08eCG4280 [Ipomoea batatas]
MVLFPGLMTELLDCSSKCSELSEGIQSSVLRLQGAGKFLNLTVSRGHVDAGDQKLGPDHDKSHLLRILEPEQEPITALNYSSHSRTSSRSHHSIGGASRSNERCSQSIFEMRREWSSPKLRIGADSRSWSKHICAYELTNTRCDSLPGFHSQQYRSSKLAAAVKASEFSLH